MINIKAQEQYSPLLKKDVFIMQPQKIYSKMNEDDTMTELRHETGLPNGVIRNALSGIRAVVKAFVCNGHSVYLPGLGTFRFSVNSKAVEDVEKVSTSLITARKLIFIPDVKIKEDLGNTSVSITCYDKSGKIIKKATSASGAVEDDDDQQTVKYTVTFKHQDAVYQTQQYEAGETIVPPQAPVGYEWENCLNVMPEEDVIVTSKIELPPLEP